MSGISIVLNNRFVEFLKPYPREDLAPFFSFRPKGYQFMPSFRAGYWDGRINLLKRNRVPTGLFLANRKALEDELGLEFKTEMDWTEVEFKDTGVVSDRDYQNECVERMIFASQQWGGGLILAATGVGKTRTAGQFFSRLIGNGCFIVDELTLLKQAQKELSEVLQEEVGEVGNMLFLPKRITVATSQTLNRHQEDPKFRTWVESLQVNIIDEVHSQINKRSFSVVEYIAPPVVFGLTATLQLQKEDVRVRAHALAGPVCYEYPLTQGQKEGHLSKGVVIQVLHPTYTATKYGAGEYSQEYTDLVVDNDLRNDVVCDLVREAARRNKFPVVVVERLKHLAMLSDMLEDIPHKVVCGDVKVEDRMLAKKHFESGELKLLLVNKVFQKGIDIKKMDVVIDAGAMKDKNRAVQVFGRGIRLAEGKVGLLHFDISDMKNRRFESAAKSRRNAFLGRGIPVKKLVSERGAKELFELAEECLKCVVSVKNEHATKN